MIGGFIVCDTLCSVWVWYRVFPLVSPIFPFFLLYWKNLPQHFFFGTLLHRLLCIRGGGLSKECLERGSTRLIYILGEVSR